MSEDESTIEADKEIEEAEGKQKVSREFDDSLEREVERWKYDRENPTGAKVLGTSEWEKGEPVELHVSAPVDVDSPLVVELELPTEGVLSESKLGRILLEHDLQPEQLRHLKGREVQLYYENTWKILDPGERAPASDEVEEAKDSKEKVENLGQEGTSRHQESGSSSILSTRPSPGKMSSVRRVHKAKRRAGKWAVSATVVMSLLWGISGVVPAIPAMETANPLFVGAIKGALTIIVFGTLVAMVFNMLIILRYEWARGTR